MPALGELVDCQIVYIKEYPVERMWRDNRLTRIGEGTDEVQRLVISRDVLKRFAQD